MTLICFASCKGSPGATTTSLVTAAVWPHRQGRRKLFVEADGDGGAVALRYQMPTKPGLISLAAAARAGLAPERLWDHAQLLPGGLPVVLAPDGSDQVSAVLQSIGGDLGQWLAGLPDVDVIADLGRLSSTSPAMSMARSALIVLFVARPEAAQLQSAAQRMAALAELGQPVGWVLIGDKPYSPEQVTGAYGFPVVRVLPLDGRAAAAIRDGAHPGRVRRSALVRTTRSMAESMLSWVESQAAGSVPPLDGWAAHAWPAPAPEPAPALPSPNGTGPNGAARHDAPRDDAASPDEASRGLDDTVIDYDEISPAIRAALQSLPERYR